MRLLSWLVGLPALVAVVVFALNNKTPVVLDLWPFGIEVEMPIYLALAFAMVLGVLLGGMATVMGQGSGRAKLREQVYEGEVAKRELKSEQQKTAELEAKLETQEEQEAPASETLPVPTDTSDKSQNAA